MMIKAANKGKGVIVAAATGMTAGKKSEKCHDMSKRRKNTKAKTI